jgi:hypothetical protein
VLLDVPLQFKEGFTGLQAVRYYVVHHAADVNPYLDITDVDRWHKNKGWIGVGYHAFIKKDGTIQRGRPTWAMGAQAYGLNAVSLGMCLAGNYSQEPEVPQAQLHALVELLRYWGKSIKQVPILGHREVIQLTRDPESASACPGDMFPLEKVKDLSTI